MRPDSRLLLTAILVLHMGMAIWFAVSVPLWEHADEINHFQYIAFIAREGRLPTAADRPHLPSGFDIYIEYDQPPLYYLLLSPLIRLVGPPSMTDIYPNPTTNCPGIRFSPYYIDPYRVVWPPQGTALAGWTARAATMMIGAASIIAVWWAAGEMFGWKRWLPAQVTMAFALMPLTLNVTTWINNDAPLLLTGALALGAVAAFQRSRHWAWAWAAIGLGFLSALFKLTGIVVLAMLPGYLLIGYLRRSPRRVIALAVAATLCALLFVQLNQWQCGQPVCRLFRYDGFDSWQAFLESWTTPAFADLLPHFLRTLATPYIDIGTLPPLYLTAAALMVMGIGVLAALRYPCKYHGVALASALVAGALGLGVARVWWLHVGYFHARYIAVALAALVCLVVYGWDRLRLGWLPAAVFAIASLMTPPNVYQPLFGAPPPVTVLPSDVVRISNVGFQAGIRLEAYHIAASGALELYFRRNQAVTQPYYLEVSTEGNDGETSPTCGETLGTALDPPMMWPSGAWIRQTIPLDIPTDASRLKLTLFPLVNDNYITNRPDYSRPDSQVIVLPNAPT